MKLEPVPITMIFGRADAGVSARPFRCEGEDGLDYYVKLRNCSYKGLLAEWIGARLAELMKLPIAEFRFVRVSESLHRSLPAEFAEIGSGIGFASLKAPAGSREMLASDIERVNAPSTLADLLAFDRWIHNEDRKLGPRGGNPNALYLPGDALPICLIDHDSAFDANLNLESFLNDHLARDFAKEWRSQDRRRGWLALAAGPREKLEEIWDEIPEEWLYDQYGDDRPGQLTFHEVEFILDQPFQTEDTFWTSITS